MPDIDIRPIRPDDIERLQAFHRALSAEAIRLRFHSYLKELPLALAERFVTVDGRERVAFVAVDGEPERIVGVGRYDHLSPDEVEVAFVVQDDYQGRGLGTRLLATLLERAREQGVRTVVARVLPGNTPMRRLLERTGYPLTSRWDQDAYLLSLDVSGGE